MEEKRDILRITKGNDFTLLITLSQKMADGGELVTGDISDTTTTVIIIKENGSRIHVPKTSSGMEAHALQWDIATTDDGKAVAITIPCASQQLGLYGLEIKGDNDSHWRYKAKPGEAFEIVDVTSEQHIPDDQVRVFALNAFLGIGAGIGGSGTPGKSAYEIAVDNGFVGTEEEWLASLRGRDGNDGLGSNRLNVMAVKSIKELADDELTINICDLNDNEDIYLFYRTKNKQYNVKTTFRKRRTKSKRVVWEYLPVKLVPDEVGKIVSFDKSNDVPFFSSYDYHCVRNIPFGILKKGVDFIIDQTKIEEDSSIFPTKHSSFYKQFCSLFTTFGSTRFFIGKFRLFLTSYDNGSSVTDKSYDGGIYTNGYSSERIKIRIAIGEMVDGVVTVKEYKDFYIFGGFFNKGGGLDIEDIFDNLSADYDMEMLFNMLDKRQRDAMVSYCDFDEHFGWEPWNVLRHIILQGYRGLNPVPITWFWHAFNADANANGCIDRSVGFTIKPA